MARKLKNNIAQFTLAESEAIQQIEQIYKTPQSTSNTVMESDAKNGVQPVAATSETVGDAETLPVSAKENNAVLEANKEDSKAEGTETGKSSVEPAEKTTKLKKKTIKSIKPKKATNGIMVNVDMDDYKQLLFLKVETGMTLKELVLQAIHEFVESNA